jgi:hypothetical protein
MHGLAFGDQFTPMQNLPNRPVPIRVRCVLPFEFTNARRRPAFSSIDPGVPLQLLVPILYLTEQLGRPLVRFIEWLDIRTY